MSEANVPSSLKCYFSTSHNPRLRSISNLPFQVGKKPLELTLHLGNLADIFSVGDSSCNGYPHSCPQPLSSTLQSTNAETVLMSPTAKCEITESTGIRKGGSLRTAFKLLASVIRNKYRKNHKGFLGFPFSFLISASRRKFIFSRSGSLARTPLAENPFNVSTEPSSPSECLKSKFLHFTSQFCTTAQNFVCKSKLCL